MHLVRILFPHIHTIRIVINYCELMGSHRVNIITFYFTLIVVILPKLAAMFEGRNKISGSVGRMKTFCVCMNRNPFSRFRCETYGRTLCSSMPYIGDMLFIFTTKTEEEEIRLWITLKTYAKFTRGVLC